MVRQVNDNESRKRRVTDSTAKIRSACKRCRSKKIKCDQQFPSCKNCSKVNEPCVSLDPATGEDVPRSYLLFLEDRVSIMLKKLKECGVDLSSIRYNIPALGTDKPYDPSYDKEMNSGDYPLGTLLGDYLIQRGKILKGESVTADLDPKSGSVEEPKGNSVISRILSNDDDKTKAINDSSDNKLPDTGQCRLQIIRSLIFYNQTRILDDFKKLIQTLQLPS